MELVGPNIRSLSYLIDLIELPPPLCCVRFRCRIAILGHQYVTDIDFQVRTTLHSRTTMFSPSTRAAVARFADTFQFKILTVALGVSYFAIRNQKRRDAAEAEAVSSKSSSGISN